MAFWDGHRWIRDSGAERPAPTPRRTRDWIATGLALVVLLGIMIPLSGIRASTPTFTIQPAAAAAGTTVEARGTGFTRAAQVTLSLDGRPGALASARVRGNGTFRARFHVPQVAPGRYTVAATQVLIRPTRTSGASSVVASAVLVVAPSSLATGSPAPSAPATPPPEPTVTLPPAQTPPATTPEPTPIPTPTPIAATPIPVEFPTPTPGATVSPAPPPPAANPPVAGFVSRSGTNLTLNGAPYRFTGFNIYNANSRWNCWYQMVGGGLDRALTNIGDGAEVVRVWFFQKLATMNGARDWSAFDATLATARAHNMRVVVTLADHWGACESTTGRKTEAWYTTGYRSTTDAGDLTTYREFVRQVVTRYRNDPTVLMWQLVNEAETKRADGTCSSREVLHAFAADMGTLVKSLDSAHLLSLGTIGSGQCGAAGADYQYVHSVPQIDICEYHDYGHAAEGMPGDQWNGLSLRLAQCAALGKPLFVGELGIHRDEVSGSLATRASYLDQKLRTQFAAGVAGVLVWNWNDGSMDPPAHYDVAPGDPSIAVVRAY
ncbi:MAG: cellulase family glycosylhydrolase [Candidatus Limnocylindria bacterium]